MKFVLIDKITELERGRTLKAVKVLSLAEEYLADHFPTFPVLPGVLMIEALVQSAAFLVRASEDFAHSMIVLKSARNVRYGNFVSPGDQLDIEVEAIEIGTESSRFKGIGRIGTSKAVQARFELMQFNLADRRKEWSQVDHKIIREMKQRFSLLRGGD